MRIERHVFGSYKGYTTLARSAGISAEDARQLEGGVYGFGQTEDPRYAKSLQNRAAFFTRILAADRRGLTRVLAGAPDSDGRPTNLMITAVLSCSDWDRKLFGAVAHLLADKQVWQWDGGVEITAIDRSYLSPVSTISRKSVLKVAALISEIERRWNSLSPIIVSETEFGGEEIRAVEILIPPRDRGQFTSACRSLGPQLGVTLNQLAVEAPLQKVNFHFDPRLPTSAYAEFLLENGLAEGELPIAEVMTYRHFARPERMKPEARRMYVPPPMPVRKRRRAWIIWMSAALLILLVAAAVYFIERGESAKGVGMNARPTATAPAPIAAARRHGPAPGEIDSARAAMSSAQPAHLSPASLPAQRGKLPVISRAPVATASAPPESKQDRDLDNLQADWGEFLDSINQQPLTFVGAQGRAFDDFESEMQKYGLVKRIEMGATGSIAALPVLLEVRDQYFQVNSLLSDPHLNNSRALARAEQALEAYTHQAKLILNPIAAGPSRGSRMFSKVERTIRMARQRLKEMKAEGAP